MESITMEGQGHECGGVFQLTSEPGTFPIHGVNVPVTHRFYRCAGCGDELVTEDLASEVQNEAAATFRQRERFLSGAEIRALRERLGLKQEQMEAALGLGAKSLARWENDRVLQNRSMDNLLRLIERDPSCLCVLAELHGAQLPDNPVLARADLIDSTRWPRPLVARSSALATSQGTDLHTYMIFLLTEFATAGSYSDHARRELTETARSFRETARAFQLVANQSRARIPISEEEPWKREHNQVMRAAEAAKESVYGR